MVEPERRAAEYTVRPEDRLGIYRNDLVVAEGSGQGGEESEESGEEEESVREARIVKTPVDPGPKGRETHIAMGHPKFEEWCPHCVRGGAQNRPRRKKGKRKARLVRICMDCMTMKTGEDGQVVKC